MIGIRSLFVAATLLVLLVEASHYRYGTISSTKSNGRVTVTFNLAMRRSFFGSPNVGTGLGYVGDINYRNTYTSSPNFVVTNIDSANDICYATASVNVQAFVGTSYIQFQSNARIGNLNNNANGNFYFGANIVVTAAELANAAWNDGPVSGLLPIVSVPYGRVPYSFQITASDPESDTLSFRMATNSEVQGSQPTGLSCSSTGLVTLNSVLAQGFWSTQQIITDSYGNSVPVDYLLNVIPYLDYCSGLCGNVQSCTTDADCGGCGSCKSAEPGIVTNDLNSAASPRTNLPAPTRGSTINVPIGTSATFNFVGYDVNLATSNIVMFTSGVPSFVTVAPQSACDAAHGCTFIGNYTRPQLISFTATPPASADGTSSTVCVGVTSNGNSLPYSQHCVVLAVSAPASVCGNGVVEANEQCDGGDCCDSSCQFASSSVVCRTSADSCDVAETCTGSSSTCPSDAFASSSVVCRASAGFCDVDETCTGSSSACPSDAFVSSSVVCRASADSCDVAETCTGSSSACPSDAFASSSVVCRPSAGLCDVAETCTGSSTACPSDAFASSSVVCRPAANSCDVADVCSGTSAACPDVLSDSGPCFCERQNPVGFMEFYCNPAGGFYQCMSGAFASQSSKSACPAGTVCGCTSSSTECSCGGTRSPCVFPSDVDSSC